MSNKKNNRNVLLTNNSLTYFAGSELVTIDLVHEFKRRQWNVYLASFDFGERLHALCDGAYVAWIDLSKQSYNDVVHFDLMFGHHFTTFDRILVDYGLVPDRVVYASLSPYEPLESPPVYSNSLTAIFANSKETMLQLEMRGVDADRLALFENCVPDYVFEISKVRPGKLHRIAVISNHVPFELSGAADLLSEQCYIDFFGLGHTSVFVTPELLQKYDLIVTIGRTVQMCFALGVPVYCYDRFGGPGYINEVNVERAAIFNFSGRCCGRKLDARSLADDIFVGFNQSLERLSYLNDIASKRYRLSVVVDDVVEFIDKGPVYAGGGDVLRETLMRQRLLSQRRDPERVLQDEKNKSGIRLLAFYLPQFHSTPENDAWWGAGFTEWDNVRQGEPLFDGHYQPHIPGELGYYDLNEIAVLDKQAQLARQYGIEGFCFYYYWFDGQRLLEKPVDQLLQHPEIDLPFCLCWANENWTRRWDGGEQEILMRQGYAPESHQRFALDLLPYLQDARYIRVNGKPLVLVYRADIIPDLVETISAWRSVWREARVGEVYLVCVESFTTRQPSQDGFDAACEFFPHQVDFSKLWPDQCPYSPHDPLVQIADYNKLATAAEARSQSGYKRFRGVVPSWDNASRRRKGGARLFIHATPERYESWLKTTIRQTLIEQDGDERLVFINAWNEWGEGCHLEPDERYGRAWLEATLRAQRSALDVDVYEGRHILPYQQWLAEQQLQEDRKSLCLAALDHSIAFTVVIDATQCLPEQLSATLKSFATQQYDQVGLLVVAAFPAPAGLGQSVLWLQADAFPEILLNELATAAPDRWYCQIQAGDQVVESGLLLLAQRLSGAQAGLAYADEDSLDPHYGPSTPQFRPDFDLDYLRSFPFLGRFLLFRGHEFLQLGGLDWAAGSARFYDYALRFAERNGEAAICHLPTILFHASMTIYEDDAQERHGQVLLAHLQRCEIPAQVDIGLFPGSFRVRYVHENQPLVSIIIPTKNQLPMLRRCIESLLEKTTYPNYEILLVDNQSTEADALAYLQGLAALNLSNLRILSYPKPFNFSAMNNLAAVEAKGEYLVLLNNDTAMVKADWLEVMLSHAQRPEVGIVGAKLLYPDGKVQHAGVILGLRGPADHPLMGEAMDAPGYAGRLLLDQRYSAVTAACLMVRKSVYAAVGGLDEQVFKVSYNDVDFCLKVREAGYRIIWTPHAVVMHEGSVSQKQTDMAAKEAKRLRFVSEQMAMYRKWLPILAADPAYNRNLSLIGNGFELETDPLFNPNLGLTLPKILAHNGDRYGSGSYRILWPLQAMKVAALADGVHREHRLDPVHLAKASLDVIVFQRQTSDEMLDYIRECREFSGAKLIYELDDYLPNLPVNNIHKQDFPKDIQRRLKQAVSLCDRVIVSTDTLKRSLQGLHSDIYVLPNYLPCDVWGGIPARPVADLLRRPRVGWAGGVSHTGDLRLIADVVRALADRVDWVFLGMMPEGVESCVAEFYPGVDIQNYPQRLAALDLDLALAPLETNLFNECKSNLRLLEYGICGYPVIATDIEPYCCGLPVSLVKNRFKDWMAAIEEKLQDRHALWCEGRSLQAEVKQQWMLKGDNLVRWRDGWLLG